MRSDGLPPSQAILHWLVRLLAMVAPAQHMSSASPGLDGRPRRNSLPSWSHPTATRVMRSDSPYPSAETRRWLELSTIRQAAAPARARLMFLGLRTRDPRSNPHWRA